jgi:serine/threonine protein kinase
MTLIDLDASAEIGTGFSCSKYSSGYIPPEMVCCEDGKYVVKSWNNVSIGGIDIRVKEGHISELVPASYTHDVWSFGIVLYQLFTGCSFFHADNNDNIDEEQMKELFNFTEEFKQKKLSRITDLIARNLIAQMLSKDTTKRPTMARIMKHPFITKQANPVRFTYIIHILFLNILLYFACNLVV